jgi:hypothetical protein
MKIPALRLANQGIASPRRAAVGQLVARLGAVQAQEFPFAKWGVGLRLRDVTDQDVEAAFTDGEILRTHVLRPTWHFVAAEDIVWMLELSAPRVHVSMRSYLQRQGLDAVLMSKALRIVERALEGGQHLTRAELGARLRRGRFELTAMQLGFVTMYAELERIVCSGPRRGKSFTYALLAERAPAARRLGRDESLGLLAVRFFSSHGPATARDFIWWSGLRAADARRGIDIARLRNFERDGLTYWSRNAVARPGPGGVYLLPIYDEYLVAYRDRVAVPHGPVNGRWPSLSVTFRHALIIDGQVAGTWTVTRQSGGQRLTVTLLRRASQVERANIAAAAQRYALFIGAQPQVVIA